MKQPPRILGLTCLGLALVAVGIGTRPILLDTIQKKKAAQAEDARTAALKQQLGTLLNAVHADPKSVEAHRALADFYQEQRLFKQALEQRVLIANLNPKNVSDQIQVGTTLIALHSYPEAETVYSYITKHWPQNISAWQGLSTVLYHQKRYLEAWRAGQEALKLDPSDGNNHLLVSVSALSYALEYPNPQAHAEILAAARKDLEALSKEWPNNGNLCYQLGLACEAQRDQKARLEYLTRAVNLLPRRGDVAAALARAYESKGDRKTARKTLQDAIARNIDSPVIHDQLGLLIQASGEPNADAVALQEFNKAVQARPNSSTYLEHFAATCVRLNKLKEAQVLFEQVTRLKPYRPYAYQQLAAIYTRLGDRAKATEAAKLSAQMYHNENQLKQVQQLSYLHPDSVPLHLILADRYRELKQQGASRDEYLTVLELDPKNVRAQAGLKALQQSNEKATKRPDETSASTTDEPETPPPAPTTSR